MHTSMKFLAEIATLSRGMSLREDQILFMLSSKLKDLAGELNIFIQSATQLNGKSFAMTRSFQPNQLGSILSRLTGKAKSFLDMLIPWKALLV